MRACCDLLKWEPTNMPNNTSLEGKLPKSCSRHYTVLACGRRCKTYELNDGRAH